MRRRNFCIPLILTLLLILLSGCNRPPNELDTVLDEEGYSSRAALPLTLDEGESYTGFSTLPEGYAIEEAEGDGCYIVDKRGDGQPEHRNRGVWNSFRSHANDGEESSIRTMVLYDDATYFFDLFYRDGQYCAFSTGGNDLLVHDYPYLVEAASFTPKGYELRRVVLSEVETMDTETIDSYLLSSVYQEFPFQLLW